MHLREGEFSRAHTDFFEAFKNYDESGSPRLEQSHTSHALSFSPPPFTFSFPLPSYNITPSPNFPPLPLQATGLPQVPGAGQHADEVRNQPL